MQQNIAWTDNMKYSPKEQVEFRGKDCPMMQNGKLACSLDNMLVYLCQMACVACNINFYNLCIIICASRTSDLRSSITTTQFLQPNQMVFNSSFLSYRKFDAVL